MNTTLASFHLAGTREYKKQKSPCLLNQNIKRFL